MEVKLQDFEFIDAQFGYNCSKRACNVINGILYDVGSMSPSEFKLTKPEKRVALNIEQKFISESNILNKAYQNGVDVNKITDYLSKLSDNGTDIYSADARVILKDLTPDEQKTAIKIIRVQKKLIKFFDGLSCEEQNCYDSAVKNIDITRYTTTSLLKRILYYCFLFE